jgi:hypothetical protein
MHEPFGQGCLQRPERLFGNDRLLPFIHLVLFRNVAWEIADLDLVFKRIVPIKRY